MESSLIDNMHTPSWDEALMQALARVDGPSAADNGLAIGVEGADGEVYRVVRTRGLTETVRVFESARALGFGIAQGRVAGEHTLQRVLKRMDA